jgi:hypothetical protein
LALAYIKNDTLSINAQAEMQARKKTATGRSTPWLILLRIGIRSTGALRQRRIETTPQR